MTSFWTHLESIGARAESAMINVNGGDPFIFTEQEFEKTTALLVFNKSIDLLEEPKKHVSQARGHSDAQR